MFDKPEENEDRPIQEIWITKAGLRQRVYRGSSQAQIEWKLQHHADSRPELITPKK